MWRVSSVLQGCRSDFYNIVAFILSLFLFIGASPTAAVSQTEAECLQSFVVDTNKTVTYIASDPTGMHLPAIERTSCSNAEMFREQLYVSMDQSMYDSEAALEAKLEAAKSGIANLRLKLASSESSSETKTLLLGASVVVGTPWAISTTAACATSVVDGVGIAACGPAARASVGAVYAWQQLISAMSDLAAVKKKANEELSKAQAEIDQLQQGLNASVAMSMKANYNSLFVGICRAVQKQCL